MLPAKSNEQDEEPDNTLTFPISGKYRATAEEYAKGQKDGLRPRGRYSHFSSEVEKETAFSSRPPNRTESKLSSSRPPALTHPQCPSLILEPMTTLRLSEQFANKS
jgi:hypothetical protein